MHVVSGMKKQCIRNNRCAYAKGRWKRCRVLKLVSGRFLEGAGALIFFSLAELPGRRVWRDLIRCGLRGLRFGCLMAEDLIGDKPACCSRRCADHRPLRVT